MLLVLRTYHFIQVDGQQQGLGVEDNCIRAKGRTGRDRGVQGQGAKG